MPESDFERRLGTLLRQTADDIPPELDVSARVHQKYYATGGRRWMAVASMVAVVALLAGTFALFRGAGFRLGPGPITLHVDSAYADTTATVVTFHFTGPRTDVVYSPILMSLTDAAGNSLPEFVGGGVGDAPGALSALFAPLPPQALGVRQTLTLTTTDLDAVPLNVPDGSVDTSTSVRGFWEAKVAVTPIAGTSTPLQIAAQTHGNLTIQPLRIDVSPGAPYPGDSYLPGGMRFLLRMSGLMPGTTQFPRLATAYNMDPQGGGASGGLGSEGSHSSLSAAGNTSGILPAFVISLDAQGLPQQIPGTVDASGAVEFELNYIFQLQEGRQILGMQLRGPLTLTIDSITLDTSITQNTGPTIPGPWVFHIPNP